MTLQDLDSALKSVCSATYELAAPAGAVRAVVWHCYGAAHLLADDCTVVDVPKVQIDRTVRGRVQLQARRLQHRD